MGLALGERPGFLGIECDLSHSPSSAFEPFVDPILLDKGICFLSRFKVFAGRNGNPGAIEVFHTS